MLTSCGCVSSTRRSPVTVREGKGYTYKETQLERRRVACLWHGWTSGAGDRLIGARQDCRTGDDSVVGKDQAAASVPRVLE
mmetsp:Transcript_53622/g.127773  ORF Transcript_53622/g.127773 Transcript_53622/m.127773 type:complete len:81 (+) Transcript_53622:67-309(+)